MTRRALIIGAVAASIIGLLAPYAIHILRGSYMALDFSAPAAIGLLFIFMLINRRLGRFRLSSAELLVVYSMMLMASAVVTLGLVAQLVTIPSGVHYYGSTENHWGELIAPHLPAWTGPGLLGSAVIGLYEGGGKAPWLDWLPMLAAWLPFIACLYIATIAAMGLLHKQWVENERLAYPLTQLPVALAQGRLVPAFWVGFAVVFALGCLAGLHHYFPAIPNIALDRAITVNAHQSLSFRVSPPMLGFFYLTGSDAVFSLWSFSLLTQAVRAVMGKFGIGLTEMLGIFGSPGAEFKYLGLGAFLALVGYVLWMARDELGRSRREQRGAWQLIGVCLAIMVLWLCATGLAIWITIPLIIFALVFFIGLTRIVAETGLAETVAPCIAPSAIAGLFGFGALGREGMAGLGLSYVWCSDIRTFPMASAVHTFKLLKCDPQPVFILSLAIAAVVSIWFTLTRAYRLGGINMDTWFFGAGARAPWEWASCWAVQKPAPSIAGWFLAGAGGAVYLALALLRYKGFPVPHPVGFAVGSTWIMSELWCTALLVWAIKYLILRYGGRTTYEKAKPIFLGLIAGQYVCNLAWLGIDALVGGRGNSIFWI